MTKQTTAVIGSLRVKNLLPKGTLFRREAKTILTGLSETINNLLRVKFSVDDILKYLSLFIPENRI